MRLKRIELYDNFRSLKNGFTLDFLEDSTSYDINEQSIDPFCIVGRNGSGKSNILELLSAIFYQVEISCLDFLPKEMLTRIEKVDDDEIEFEDEIELSVFQSNTTKPNAYKLEYYITYGSKEALVTIKKEADQYRVVELTTYDEKGVPTTSKQDKVNLQNKELPVLPEYIIGYSSGQNEILSLPFFKIRLIQYDEYVNYLKLNNNFESHESRMVYLDDVFSQAIFITNFIYSDTKVNEVFKNTIGVETVESFRIIINQNISINTNDEEKKYIRSEVLSKIELLKNCATMFYNKEDDINQLVLDYYLDDEVKKAFILSFGYGKQGRLNLFQTLQTLINLNYYYIDEPTKHKLYNSQSLFAKGYLPETPWNKRFFTFKHFMLKKQGTNETILSRSLSDGEYQFLHSIGLALIYRDTQSLFLLDEPETHFNPSWRAQYMSVLKQCFEETTTRAEFLITSHSPFIVSDTKTENVILFDKTVDGDPSRQQISFNTFGASVNKITSKIFGKNDSMGDVSKELMDSYREKIADSQNLKDLMNDIENDLGESVEKILLLKVIFDKLEENK